MTPADALSIINALNLPSAPLASAGRQAAADADLNGDGVISALDVLLVVNYLNALPHDLAWLLPTDSAPPGRAEAEPESADTASTGAQSASARALFIDGGVSPQCDAARSGCDDPSEPAGHGSWQLEPLLELLGIDRCLAGEG